MPVKIKKLLIVGAGGLGRELYPWARDLPELDVLGFVDSIKNPPFPLPANLLGGDPWALEKSTQNPEEELFFTLAIGSSTSREKLGEKYMDAPLSPINLIHPHALPGSEIKLSEGIIICAGSILTTNIRLGNFVIINLQCTLGHDCVIEDYVTLHPGVRLSGDVHVGRGTEIGTGAIVLPGITIGSYCKIGAGAVVTRDCEPGKTYVGVPARATSG